MMALGADERIANFDLEKFPSDVETPARAVRLLLEHFIDSVTYDAEAAR